MLPQTSNIFISNDKIMDKLPTRVIDGNPVSQSPAIVLLYLNPEKKLQPIAIQVFNLSSPFLVICFAYNRNFTIDQLTIHSWVSSPQRTTRYFCRLTQSRTGCWPRCLSGMQIFSITL